MRVIEALKRVVFPPKCLCCGAFFHPPFEKGHEIPAIPRGDFHAFLSPFLCATCLKEWIPVSSPICTVCGAVFTSREGGDRPCGDCVKHPKRFTAARAVGVYDQSLRIVIHRLKYQGKTQLAAPLGNVLLHALIRIWPPGDIDLIIPMPLHEKRLRHRGFNQAHLLVRGWRNAAERLGVHPESYRIGPDILIRTRMTKPQTGLGKKQRKANIRNAFHVKETKRVDGKRILLVDDVYTTGATVNECARVLRRAGAGRVFALTLARAP